MVSMRLTIQLNRTSIGSLRDVLQLKSTEISEVGRGAEMCQMHNKCSHAVRTAM